jgi:uncharacterized protein YdhG (YjbR/CyaY superfamily)
MATVAPASVNEYIAAQPEAARPALARVRSAIRAAVPRAEESISYKMPTYKLLDKPVLYFACWKQHYSLYPASQRLLAEFKEELRGCEIQKSTLRFPLSEPVPVKLIGRIAKFRAHEIAGKA